MPSSAVPDRVAWAVDRLDLRLRPGLRILFGPGPDDPTDALSTARRQVAASPFGRAGLERSERGAEIRATKM